MKKADFVQILVDKTGLTKKDVAAVVDAYENAILENVIAPCESYRTQFGTISGYMHDPVPEKTMRNPSNGQPIKVPAKPAYNAPRIKWSKAAKE